LVCAHRWPVFPPFRTFSGPPQPNSPPMIRLSYSVRVLFSRNCLFFSPRPMSRDHLLSYFFFSSDGSPCDFRSFLIRGSIFFLKCHPGLCFLFLRIPCCLLRFHPSAFRSNNDQSFFHELFENPEGCSWTSNSYQLLLRGPSSYSFDRVSR